MFPARWVTGAHPAAAGRQSPQHPHQRPVGCNRHPPATATVLFTSPNHSTLLTVSDARTPLRPSQAPGTAPVARSNPSQTRSNRSCSQSDLRPSDGTLPSPNWGRASCGDSGQGSITHAACAGASPEAWPAGRAEPPTVVMLAAALRAWRQASVLLRACLHGDCRRLHDSYRPAARPTRAARAAHLDGWRLGRALRVCQLATADAAAHLRAWEGPSAWEGPGAWEGPRACPR